MDDHIDIVFDGPPAQEMPRLVEVGDARGRSINVGEWVKRPDARWVHRIWPARTVQGHLLPSCSLVQHVWFTPINGNASELCTTEKRCLSEGGRQRRWPRKNGRDLWCGFQESVVHNQRRERGKLG